MRIAIIGLPNSGKTTVFNALTGGQAETTAFASGRFEPNLAAVKVPDPRLEVLARMSGVARVVPAEVHYVDIGGFSGSPRSGGEIPPEVLNYIAGADAFLQVVRAFEDDRVPHPLASVDAVRDVASLDLELILTDLALVERRLERLEKEIPKLPAKEKAGRVEERELLFQLKDTLENELPLRDKEISPQQELLLRGYTLLSSKPTLLAINVGEDELAHPPAFEYPHRRSAVVFLSARLEEELCRLEKAEAREFMAELGIETPARDRVIAASYHLMELVSFLTIGTDEVRAWPIRRGTPAVEAAGAVHSDMQRGFIRAEVIPFEDLATAGSMVEAKKRGLVRVEGKQYPVQDGDVCHFLFHV